MPRRRCPAGCGGLGSSLGWRQGGGLKPALRGSRHSGWVAGTVADGVDDDLGFRGLVEDQVRVRLGRHSANSGHVGPRADVRMKWQQGDDRLDATLDPVGTPGRVVDNGIEQGTQVVKRCA